MKTHDHDERIKMTDGNTKVLVIINREAYERYQDVCREKGIGAYALYLSKIAEKAMIKFCDK